MNKRSRELTTKGRHQVKSKNFVFPGKEKYPIHDRGHAANALSRVSQFGSPGEKAKVRAKVHAMYPGMGKHSALISFKAYADEMSKLSGALTFHTGSGCAFSMRT